MAEPRCWADRRDWAAETYGWASPEHVEALTSPDASCLLPDGHAGPHVWTPDDQIFLMLPPGQGKEPAP